MARGKLPSIKGTASLNKFGAGCVTNLVVSISSVSLYPLASHAVDFSQCVNLGKQVVMNQLSETVALALKSVDDLA